VITDFGVLEPDAQTEDLTLTALFEGATVDEARGLVGWPLAVAASLASISPPSVLELDTLRALHARTREAHGRPVLLPA